MSSFFENIAESRIETSNREVNEELVYLKFDEDIILVPPNVKHLFTNVPVVEYSNLVAMNLYGGPVTPPFEKGTFIAFMKLAVTNVAFMCDGKWFV